MGINTEEYFKEKVCPHCGSKNLKLISRQGAYGSYHDYKCWDCGRWIEENKG